MLRTLRLLAGLLVMAVVAANAMAKPVGLPAKDVGHPTGCHDPIPAAPSHAPASHDCCVSGHHSAIPGSAFSLRPIIVQFPCGSDCDLRAIVISFKCSVERITASDSPPSAAPLRI